MGGFGGTGAVSASFACDYSPLPGLAGSPTDSHRLFVSQAKHSQANVSDSGALQEASASMGLEHSSSFLKVQK